MKKSLLCLESCFFGIYLGSSVLFRVCGKVMKIEKKRSDKINEYFNVCFKWLRVYQNNCSTEIFFKEEGITEVAIYGMGKLGTCLLEELKKTNVSVKYIIDRNSEQWQTICPCFLPSDKLPGVQAIVITPFTEYDEIVGQLSEKINARMISLKQVIDKSI